MINLASVIDRGHVIKAIKTIKTTKPVLNPATKYHLVYEGKSYPPKEIVRYAAREKGLKSFSGYSLVGGPPTNNHLQKLGFDIRQFKDWQVDTVRPQVRSELPQKISRLVWNNNGWKKPSGRGGKSSSDSYEKKHGHGHEEWLLDLSKIVNGYHYGFLEPINKYRSTYEGKKFNILLYTVNGKTAERFFIGVLNCAEVISVEESLDVLEIYKQRGWTREMRADLVQVELDPRKLDRWIREGTVLNVKFKPSDYRPFAEPIPVADYKRFISSDRYQLLNRDFRLDALVSENKPFVLNKGIGSRILKQKSQRSFTPNVTQHPLLHNLISMGLEKALKKRFKQVVAENDTGYGTLIDIVTSDGSGYNFYEIKTYDHIRMCIRMALGQLVEYNCFQDRAVAKRLYIVSQHKADKEHIRYIEHLRKLYRLPLHYMCFDIASDSIIQEF